ncbi:hypothetical protein LZ31DRAFT_349105 [Colletotrichum somersetense]|nr:hypothetical protein LZ31DRAFT_349105 [Colletotrichum somersetense]
MLGYDRRIQPSSPITLSCPCSDARRGLFCLLTLYSIRVHPKKNVNILLAADGRSPRKRVNNQLFTLWSFGRQAQTLTDTDRFTLLGPCSAISLPPVQECTASPTFAVA